MTLEVMTAARIPDVAISIQNSLSLSIIFRMSWGFTIRVGWGRQLVESGRQDMGAKGKGGTDEPRSG